MVLWLLCRTGGILSAFGNHWFGKMYPENISSDDFNYRMDVERLLEDVGKISKDELREIKFYWKANCGEEEKFKCKFKLILSPEGKHQILSQWTSRVNFKSGRKIASRR